MPENSPSDAMPVSALGHLTRIDPRTVWKHEAHDFTPWLRENADRLADALGIELELSGAEHPVGAFSLDLIGRDISHDKPLIVENQLAASDHGHLGQLLTYAAGTGAATIVWIATSIRDEHRQTLDWLNEQTGEETHFFGVELELVQIGDSLPAPLFNVVVLPNDWQKSVKAATAAASGGGKGTLYAAFWQRFLDRLSADRPGWSKAKQGTANSWFPMSAGLPHGCMITASFAAGGKLRNEFYIDRATPDECKELFDRLVGQKELIEAVYGEPLSWERLDNRKAARVAAYRDGDVTVDADHDTYIEWFVDAGDRLRAAIAKAEIS
ncbi:MAG: DUF4268 domain-containing protein [Acidimicrobiia bacterium]